MPTGRRPRRWRGPLIVALLVLAYAAVLTPNALLTAQEFRAYRAAESAPEHPMIEVAPGGAVSLEDLPHDHAATYHAAADHAPVFEQVRCHCGCESFLRHTSLRACFVRPDGGWERHATGCAVCLAEARDVLDGIEAGRTTDAIIERIDARYGQISA